MRRAERPGECEEILALALDRPWTEIGRARHQKTLDEILERRVRSSHAITVRIKQDDYDRAQVLAQLAADLASDPRIGRSVLFKGGAILQMAHQSPRFSRDLDATAIAQQTIEKRWVEDVLSAHRVGNERGYVQRYELVEH